MVNTKFKFVVGQARTINLYRNTRSKLLKCNANIYFNKQCLARKVIPMYTTLKFTNISPFAQIRCVWLVNTILLRLNLYLCIVIRTVQLLYVVICVAACNVLFVRIRLNAFLFSKLVFFSNIWSDIYYAQGTPSKDFCTSRNPTCCPTILWTCSTLFYVSSMYGNRSLKGSP